MQHVFIVGSKGIPAQYGGFETFVEKLTAYRKDNQICYHISRISDHDGEYEYNDAKCFDVKVPSLGPAKAILYDCKALSRSIRIWKTLRNEGATSRPVFYVLACRIGPFAGHYKKAIHKLGGELYVNPDGHEWMRSKWSKPVRAYWKFSEKLMVKHADLLICDSKNIEKYIRETYAKYAPKTTFIAYGADVEIKRPQVDPQAMAEALADGVLTKEEVRGLGVEARYTQWLKEKGLEANNYYLVVGRFVPENNIKTIIQEFMWSSTRKKLAIVTTENEKLFKELENTIHFSRDERIQFVGTVYDQELLTMIRENAYGYIHGHEVGGTNPSLLEALSTTKLNLLLDVGFNHEVGEEAAIYWTKDGGSLARAIESCDSLSQEPEQIEAYGAKAKARIRENYSWDYIVSRYESVFRA